MLDALLPVALVLLAAGWLGWRAWRAVRGVRGGCGCGTRGPGGCAPGAEPLEQAQRKAPPR